MQVSVQPAPLALTFACSTSAVQGDARGVKSLSWAVCSVPSAPDACALHRCHLGEWLGCQERGNVQVPPAPDGMRAAQVPSRGMPGGFRGSAGCLQNLPLSRGRPEVMGRPGRRPGEQGPDAERKAQQERMYLLDYNKVMAGTGSRPLSPAFKERKAQHQRYDKGMAGTSTTP